MIYTFTLIPAPQLIADLDLSASQYGILTGFATGLVYALFALPLGFLTERYFRRVWVLAAGCVWWSACMCFQVGSRSRVCPQVCLLLNSMSSLLVNRMY